MQSLKISRAAGAMALAAATLTMTSGLGSPAAAQTFAAFQGVAKLQTPVAARSETLINGVTWTCEGDACTGYAARYLSMDGLVRECKQVAAALGPLATYEARGRTADRTTLKLCNSAASTAASGAAPAAKP